MSTRSIALIDYKAGNLCSVANALTSLGHDHVITHDPHVVASCDRIIFPGVGDALATMAALRDYGLDEALLQAVDAGKPLLAICVGAQLMLERSEERDSDGLGLIAGITRRFSPTMGLKVPHMGWNTIELVAADNPLFAGVASRSSFYFLHSYYMSPVEERNVIAYSDYGIQFVAAVCRDNLYAVQFHPEKSGRNGLRLLDNFVAVVPR